MGLEHFLLSSIIVCILQTDTHTHRHSRHFSRTLTTFLRATVEAHLERGARETKAKAAGLSNPSNIRLLDIMICVIYVCVNVSV